MAPLNDFNDKQPKVSHKFDEQKQASFIEEYKNYGKAYRLMSLFYKWMQCTLPKGLKCHLDEYVKG
jgi:hypothetical protein